MDTIFVYIIKTPGRLLGIMLSCKLKVKIELNTDFGDRDWTQGLCMLS